MVELTRQVRFFLNGPDPRLAYDPSASSKAVNGFSAWPAARGLGRYYQLEVRCAGQADPTTGYFINIKQIDQAVRDTILPFLEQTLDTTRPSAMLPVGALMQQMLHLLQPALDHTVKAICLELSPFHSLTLQEHAMSQVIIRQQFEFAAAHRLHVPEFSEQENISTFGKCNNPSGHGHNYRLEVAVRTPIDAHGHILLVEQLDQRVDSVVIQKLDHKHLNIDVPQFAHLNPSCENIAKVICQMLIDQLADLNATLEEVTVWETSKTSCTYRPTKD